MTNWSRERWRKLYVREPLEQQAWGWAARGLRDLLIRVAEDDGRVARSRERLRQALHVASADDLFASCLEDLLDDGFLVEDASGVYVRNLPVAQGDERALESEPEPENESPEDRRKRLARDRKRRSRSRGERDQARDNKRDTSVTERDRSTPPLPPSHSPSPLPDSQKNQTEETDEAAAAGAGERDQSVTERVTPARDRSRVTERDSVTGGLVPCPEDLRLTDAQRRTLETAMIPPWAIEALTLDFVTAAVGGAERRTLDVWRKCLSKAITGNWNDPSRRPKPPGATDGRASVGDLLARATRLREQELAAGSEGSS